MRQHSGKRIVRIETRQTKSRAASDVDYGSLGQFRYQLRQFLAFSKANAQKAGLTPQQHQALLAIKGFSNPNPISVGDLAKYLLIKHHSAVELVDRMIKLDLLSRFAADKDGRRVFVKLTRKGEQRLRVLSKIHFEELRIAGPALTKILKVILCAASIPALKGHSSR